MTSMTFNGEGLGPVLYHDHPDGPKLLSADPGPSASFPAIDICPRELDRRGAIADDKELERSRNGQ